jgi:phosphoenolpyruvate carboxykinase (ATP)
MGDATLYDQKTVELAQKFKANFAKFEEFANSETMAGTESIS